MKSLFLSPRFFSDKQKIKVAQISPYECHTKTSIWVIFVSVVSSDWSEIDKKNSSMPTKKKVLFYTTCHWDYITFDRVKWLINFAFSKIFIFNSEAKFLRKCELNSFCSEQDREWCLCHSLLCH